MKRALTKCSLCCLSIHWATWEAEAIVQSSKMEVLDFSTTDSSPGPLQLVHTRPITGLDRNKQQPGEASPVACVKSCVWHSSNMPLQSAKGLGKQYMAFPLRGMCQQLILYPFQGNCSQSRWRESTWQVIYLRCSTQLCWERAVSRQMGITGCAKQPCSSVD